MEWLKSLPRDVLEQKHNDDDLKNFVEKIATQKRDVLRGYSIDCLVNAYDAVDNKFRGLNLNIDTFHVYFGLTKRTLKEEGYRWATRRGYNHWVKKQNYNGQRNRPVLTYLEKEVIGQKALIEDFGFQCIELCKFHFMTYASRVEDLLQLRYHDKLPLGYRLWRAVAKGASHQEDPAEYKVFMTFAFNLKIGNKVYVQK